jgi:hypothetical protein
VSGYKAGGFRHSGGAARGAAGKLRKLEEV